LDLLHFKQWESGPFCFKTKTVKLVISRSKGLNFMCEFRMLSSFASNQDNTNIKKRRNKMKSLDGFKNLEQVCQCHIYRMTGLTYFQKTSLYHHKTLKLHGCYILKVGICWCLFLCGDVWETGIHTFYLHQQSWHTAIINKKRSQVQHVCHSKQWKQTNKLLCTEHSI
jgi:hypothetical protein